MGTFGVGGLRNCAVCSVPDLPSHARVSGWRCRYVVRTENGGLIWLLGAKFSKVLFVKNLGPNSPK